MGGEITYQYLDSFKYLIKLTIYRNCSSHPVIPAISFSCLNGNASPITINSIGQAKKITDITSQCSYSSNNCASTRNFDGVEKWEFEYLLDLDSPSFEAFKSCDKIRVSSGQCCRGNLTTGGANSNFSIFTDINLTENINNSTPILTIDPQRFICCNNSFYHNMGALDTVDNDSLSYHWAHPMINVNINLGYTGQYLAYNHPLSVFYPSGAAPPVAFPEGIKGSGPPVGIYLDSKNGDLIFTPSSCGQETVAVLEVKEWRRLPVILSNGDTLLRMQEVGSVKREQRFSVTTCSPNNTPKIIADWTHAVCETDQICIPITAEDDIVTNVYGDTLIGDSVKISWNKAIPNGTFVITDSTSRIQKAEVCWTPKLGDARSNPYYFVAIARDNSCSKNVISSKAISIKVNPYTPTHRTIDSIGCNQYSIRSTLKDTAQVGTSFFWQLLDTGGNVLSSRRDFYFVSNKQTFSHKQSDTIQFKKAGTYYLTHSANDCKITLDTIVVQESKGIFIFPKSSYIICEMDSLYIEPVFLNLSSPLQLQWATFSIGQNGNFLLNQQRINPRDTLNYFNFLPLFNSRDTGLTLLAIDANGCELRDWVSIRINKNPMVKLFTPDISCATDSVQLMSDISFSRFGASAIRWYYENSAIPIDSIHQNLKVFAQGKYRLEVTDLFDCLGMDEIDVVKNAIVNPNAGNDRAICFGTQVIIYANGLDTANGKSGVFSWYDITSNTSVFLGNMTSFEHNGLFTKKYRLKLSVTENGINCEAYDDVAIQVFPIPTLEIPMDDIVSECFSYTLPSLPKGNYFTKSGGNGMAFMPGDIIDSSQRFYVFVREQVCDNEKSFEIIINDLPKVDEIGSQIACQYFVLPILQDGSYFDQPDGQGNLLSAGDQIQQNATLYIFNRNSCGTNERAFDIAIVPNPSNAVSVSENTLTATEADASYQWLDCKQNKDPISGAIFQSYTSSQSAELAVEVSKNGCTVTSNCINLIHSNIELKQIEKIELYPNPNSGRFVVNLGSIRNVKITIYDMNGKVVYLEEDIEESLKNIEIKGAAGVYQMEIETEGERRIFKVVKEN